MKKTNYIVFLLTLTMLGCSGRIGSSKDLSSEEIKEEPIQIFDPLNYNGIWAESEDENALFTIEDDTIINVEHGDKMYFSVANDSMTINYDGFVGRYLIIKHSRDSLILRNEDGSTTRLYRR